MTASDFDSLNEPHLERWESWCALLRHLCRRLLRRQP